VLVGSIHLVQTVLQNPAKRLVNVNKEGQRPFKQTLSASMCVFLWLYILYGEVHLCNPL